MGIQETLLMVGFMLLSGLIILYSSKTPKNWKPPGPKEKKRKLNELVFFDRQEGETHLLELAKTHPLQVIVWFNSDLELIKGKLGENHTQVSIYAYDAFAGTDINPDIPLVMWGHHPIASIEDKTMKKLNAVMNLTTINSLDDALIHHFGGEKIKSSIEKMGFKKGEVLENSLLSTSIRYAQEDLDKKVQNPVSANSAAEWFSLNVGSI